MQKKILLLLLIGFKMTASSPQDSLETLLQGNQRFCTQKLTKTSKGQVTSLSYKVHSPFAVIVCCSDARVAPEIVFDQGLGDLFVVRVAGNVIGPYELESIRFAVGSLGANCILVIGHQNCGAVNAVVENQITQVPYLAQLIQPAVTKARQEDPSNLLKRSIELNAIGMVSFLNEFKLFSDLKAQKKLIIVPAYHDFTTGQIQILDSNL